MILVQVQEFVTSSMYTLEILQQCVKRVKTKSQKVLVVNPLFLEVTREKLVGGLLALFSILTRVKGVLIDLHARNFEYLKILCTTYEICQLLLFLKNLFYFSYGKINLQNQQKVEKTLYYYQIKGWISF